MVRRRVRISDEQLDSVVAQMGESFDKETIASSRRKRFAVPKLTKEQAVIITAYTGIMCCEMADLHEYAKRKLDITEDLGSVGIVMIADRLKEASKEDFLALVE